MTGIPHALRVTLVRDQRHTTARAADDLMAWLSWLELGGASEETRTGYEWSLAKLLRSYPAKAMDEFTADDLMLWLRTYPPKSWRTRAAPARGWFHWGKKTRRIPENIADDLPRFKRHKSADIEVFTEIEIDRLQGLRLPHGVLMQIMIDTGARRGELLHMRAMDVQADRGRILIRDEGAKGGEGRKPLVGAHLLYRIKEWFDLDGINPQDFLWAPKPGGFAYRRYALPGKATAMSDTSFMLWWKQCLEDAAVRYRKPHTTRHTTATRWLRAGGRRETLKRQLGHKSIRTIDVYEHLDDTDIRGDVDLIEALRR